jgi:glycogen debranching enzyme
VLNLGSPFCCRQTDLHPRLSELGDWLAERAEAIKARVPAFLRPKYFALLVSAAGKAAGWRALDLCTSLIRDGTTFTRSLALCSIQLYGTVRSASLDPKRETPSQAAGLPHFASGWARVWGRDCAIVRGTSYILVWGVLDTVSCLCRQVASSLRRASSMRLARTSLRWPRVSSMASYPISSVSHLQESYEIGSRDSA